MICFRPKLKENQANTTDIPRSTECGNVIFIIFLGILLFGALTFTFSQGFRSGESSVSKETAQLLAADLLESGRAMKQAVHMLQIDGCDETEINFYNSVISGYSNGLTKSDKSCDVFEPEGAGLRWIEPDDNASDNASSSFYTWYYSGYHCINDIGTCDTGEEAGLMMFLPYIQDNVCRMINDKVGMVDFSDGSIPVDDISIVAPVSATQFTGTYDTSITTTNTLGDPTVEGHAAGCIQDNAGATSGSNYFYQVLITR